MNSPSVRPGRQSQLSKLEENHPSSLIVNLLLLAGSAFFIYLIATLLAAGASFRPEISAEALFGVCVILIPAYFLPPLHLYFEKEKTVRLFISLAISASCLTLFCVFQFTAWFDIIDQSKTSPSIGPKIFALIVLSHGALAILATVYLMVEMIRYAKPMRDPVRRLLIYTNPFEKLRLSFTKRFVLFVQVSWVITLLVLTATT